MIEGYGVKKLVVEIRELNPTKEELRRAFERIIENINKKNVYLAIAKFIINQLELLYEEEVSGINVQTSTQQIVHVKSTQTNESSRKAGHYESQTSIIDPREIKAQTSDLEISKNSQDWYEARLDIMQGTNPLRAKVLLYSIIVHPWANNDQDWSNLKIHSLQEMLEQFLQTCKNSNELEAKLFTAARSQDDTESSLQTAHVMIQAIQQWLITSVYNNSK